MQTMSISRSLNREREEWEPLDSEFFVCRRKKLGKGAYGSVYIGYSKREQAPVAVKELYGDLDYAWKMNQALDQQIFAMRLMNHRNVIKLKSFLIPEHLNRVYIITQFCEGPSVADILEAYRKKNSTMPREDVLPLFEQLVEGMIHIHEKGMRVSFNKIQISFAGFWLMKLIRNLEEGSKYKCLGFVHRDLTPSNVLTKNRIPKITDFGLSKYVEKRDVRHKMVLSKIGAPLYCAPNVLRSDMASGKCDVYSAGLILYEMLMGRNPFQSARGFYELQRLQKQMLKDNYRVDFEGIPDFFRTLIRRSVTFQEDDRMNFWEVREFLQCHNSGPPKEIKHMRTATGSTQADVQVNTQNQSVASEDSNRLYKKLMNCCSTTNLHLADNHQEITSEANPSEHSMKKSESLPRINRNGIEETDDSVNKLRYLDFLNQKIGCIGTVAQELAAVRAGKYALNLQQRDLLVAIMQGLHQAYLRKFLQNLQENRVVRQDNTPLELMMINSHASEYLQNSRKKMYQQLAQITQRRMSMYQALAPKCGVLASQEIHTSLQPFLKIIKSFKNSSLQLKDIDVMENCLSMFLYMTLNKTYLTETLSRFRLNFVPLAELRLDFMLLTVGSLSLEGDRMYFQNRLYYQNLKQRVEEMGVEEIREKIKCKLRRLQEVLGVKRKY